MNDLKGKTVNNFLIQEFIGKGGMGDVYKALDLTLDRIVALKLFNLDDNISGNIADKILKEAQHHAKVVHSNIINIFGAFQYKNYVFLVLEYFEAKTLFQVNQESNLSESHIIQISLNVLSALQEIHDSGIIHGDVKPENILISEKGTVKLFDFGISQKFNEMKVDSNFPGTIYYMSPEQLNNLTISHRSDIYSFGCTLFEMIMREPLFNFASLDDIKNAHRQLEIDYKFLEKLSLPIQFIKIVQKCVKKNPEERYQSCNEIVTDLKNSSKTEKLKKEAVNKVKSASSWGILFLIFVIIIILFIFAFKGTDNLLRNFHKPSSTKDVVNEEFIDDWAGSEKIYFDLNENITKILSGDENFYFLTDSKNIALMNKSSQKITIAELNDVMSTKLTFDVFGNSSKNYISKFRSELNTNFGRGIIGEEKANITQNGNINIWDSYTKTFFQLYIPDENSITDYHKISDSTAIVSMFDGSIQTISIPERRIINKIYLLKGYIKSIDMLQNGFGVAAGEENIVLITSDFWKSWKRVQVKNALGINKVYILNSNRIVVLCNKGALYVINAKTLKYKELHTETYPDLNNILVSSENEIYICGSEGFLMKININNMLRK